MSKISVDPGTFDAYFHLGGLGLILAQYGSKNSNPELTAMAKPLVQSAVRYAQDTSPGEPRIEQLQGILLEALKF